MLQRQFDAESRLHRPQRRRPGSSVSRTRVTSQRRSTRQRGHDEDDSDDPFSSTHYL